MAELDRVEARMRVKLPASVIDWYGRDGALSVLARHSNADEPIGPKQFTLARSKDRLLIPFKNENQGVCQWAFTLDGTDDPPVHVDVDGAVAPWELNAQRFSDHVLACVWDYQLVFGRASLVEGQLPPLGESVMERLNDRFETGVTTFGWPGNRQLRFSNGDTAILIWASLDQADWFLAAPDPVSLAAVISALQDCDDLGSRLYGISDLGKAAIELAGQD
jgi:hypothetical protein